MVIALAILMPGVSAAQEETNTVDAPRFWLGGDVMGSWGLGDFGDLAGGAFGVQASVRAHPTPSLPFQVQLDLGFLLYGEETRQACLPAPVGCHPDAWVTITNYITYVGVGPEADFLDGRLYLFGTLGASVFSTAATFHAPLEYFLPVVDQGHDDTVLAARVGGGVRIPLRPGHNPVLLDIGAVFHRNGAVEYMGEGDLVSHPDGSVTLVTHRTTADLVAVHLGVRLGLGGSR